jgi:hypothetical protein
MKEYYKLMDEIKAIKQALFTIERNGYVIGGWLPKKAVMRYFDYGDNQIRVLERTKVLEVSKVGRRKFYSLKSIINLIEKNKQK